MSGYNFYSLVSSIKDKSSQAMATLSSDLKEFSSIVQEDVAEVAKTMRKTVQETIHTHEAAKETTDGDAQANDEETEETAEAAQHEKDESKKPASLFSFGGAFSLESVGTKILHQADALLGTLAGEDAGNPSTREDEDDTANSERRFRLLALQEDPETYLIPPMDLETFTKWKQALSTDELQALKAEVLAHYPVVQTRFNELVPDAVAEDDFWFHYIYKASLLAAQEKRGMDLLEHALNDDEEEIGWDVESPRNEGDEEGKQPFPTEEADAVPPPAPVSIPAAAPQAEETEAPPPAAESSDGEGWVELDDRTKPQADQQPPLSTSSSISLVQKPESMAAEDEEDDLDWGNDEDEEEQAAPPADAVSTEQTANGTSSRRKQGGDWGEWD